MLLIHSFFLDDIKCSRGRNKQRVIFQNGWNMTELGLHTDAKTRFRVKMMQTAQCSVSMEEIFVVNVPEIFCRSARFCSQKGISLQRTWQTTVCVRNDLLQVVLEDMLRAFHLLEDLNITTFALQYMFTQSIHSFYS